MAYSSTSSVARGFVVAAICIAAWGCSGNTPQAAGSTTGASATGTNAGAGSNGSGTTGGPSSSSGASASSASAASSSAAGSSGSSGASVGSSGSGSSGSGSTGSGCPAGQCLVSGSCIPDTTVLGCGASCASCAVANAENTCTAGQCAYTCVDGFCDFGGGQCAADTTIAGCGSSCAVCPSDPNGAPACRFQSGQCSLDCNSGYCLDGTGDGCVQSDAQTDPSNCGQCGEVCPPDANDGGGTPTCDQGTCTLACPATEFACNGGCNDIASSTDPHDCHQCGNDCGGGWCGPQSGFQPYFADGGSSGCRAPVTAGAASSPMQLVGSPNNAEAWWVESSGQNPIMQWVPGSAPSTLTVGGGGSKTNLTVVQNQFGVNELVWLESAGSGATAATDVWEYTIGSGAAPNPRRLTSVPLSSYSVLGLTADGSNAYFTLIGANVTSYIASAPFSQSNGAYTLLSTSVRTWLTEIVRTSSSDVYALGTDNNIYGMSSVVGTTTPEVIATWSSSASDPFLTTDGRNLYFLSSATTVSEVNLAGTIPITPTVIRSGLAGASFVSGFGGSNQDVLLVNSGDQIIDIGPSGTGTATYDTGIASSDFAYAYSPGGFGSFAYGELFLVGQSDQKVYAISTSNSAF